MPLKMHKIISGKVLPEEAGGGFGVSFEFDDGWLEARFHLSKEEAERQAARGRERTCSGSEIDVWAPRQSLRQEFAADLRLIVCEHGSVQAGHPAADDGCSAIGKPSLTCEPGFGGAFLWGPPVTP
jgi:hypothetical protein